MKLEKENPFISFYGEHEITTDHHQNDFQSHLRSREKLFRTLGMPPLLFKNRRVLEVGPGRGYNALPFFTWGAKVDFVEANPRAQRELQFLMDEKGDLTQAAWQLFSKRIEDFETEKRYEIILAEGFLPGIYNREEVIQKLKSLAAENALIVVTCVDDLSFLLELVRRLLAWRLLAQKAPEDFDDKVKLLCKAFGTHLAALKHATRSVEDWVLDCFLCRSIYADFFSIEDCLKEFAGDYLLLGSSPSFLTDSSWFKDLTVDPMQQAIEQFQKKRHQLILTDMPETEEEPEANARLASLARNLRVLTEAYEDYAKEEDLEKALTILQALSISLGKLDPRLSAALEEGMELLQNPNLTEEKIADAEAIKGLFGKGVQHLSLVRQK